MKSNRERFEAMIYPDPNSGCFIFVGGVNGSGYGCFAFHVECGKKVTKTAHRVAWEFANGPIPPGLHVCHKCDTPCCANPDHLFLGTHEENQIDKAKKGRGRRSKRGLPYGVCARGDRFLAYRGGGGRDRYLGSFSTAEEASRVAIEARVALYGS